MKNKYIKLKKFLMKNLKIIISIFLFFSIIYFMYLFFKYYPYFLSFEYWGNKNNLNRAETLRNVGLIFLGIFALIIAIWRALVATKELSNTKLKLNQEKLHKAVELLEPPSERNKISAFTMLSELIKETKLFDEIIFQICKSYLNEFANPEKNFLKYKHLSPNDKVKEWYSRNSQDYSISLCFEIYLELTNQNRIQYNLNQVLLFHNLDLHGLHIIKPNHFFQNCDLSNCTIYCDKYTKFNHCDLTGAIIIPYKNNTLIFDWCNISYIRIQVPDNISPTLNGWHWEGQLPALCSFCTFISLPKDRRVVVMPSNRIMNICLQKNFYKNDDYRTKPPYGSSLFEDSLKHDSEKQKIICELEYKKSNNTLEDE